MRRDSTTSLAVRSHVSPTQSRPVDLRSTLLVAAILAWLGSRGSALFAAACAGMEPAQKAALGTLLALALAARLTRCAAAGVALHGCSRFPC